MGDSKLGLGWGGAVGGERGAGPASALANEKSPGPTVFTWRQRNGSPEKVGNTLVTITDCALSGGRFFAPRELIFNNSTDDMWRSCR